MGCLGGLGGSSGSDARGDLRVAFFLVAEMISFGHR